VCKGQVPRRRHRLHSDPAYLDAADTLPSHIYVLVPAVALAKAAASSLPAGADAANLKCWCIIDGRSA
jgi:hypothetical protein